MIELFIAFYIVCAVLSFGFSFAYFQRRWELIAESEYHSDLIFCLSFSMLGPIWLILYALATGTEGLKYGLKFW